MATPPLPFTVLCTYMREIEHGEISVSAKNCLLKRAMLRYEMKKLNIHQLRLE